VIEEALLEQLRGLGFTARRREKQQVEWTSIYHDPLNHLLGWPPAFTFVTFQDEMVAVESQRISGDVFGWSDQYGPFIRSAEGSVYLLVTNECYVDEFGADLVFVNSGFLEFVRCYSLFAAALFEVRAFYDDLDATGVRLAEDFTRKVAAIDPPGIKDGTFWSQYAFMLEEVGLSDLPTHTPLMAYVRTDRILPPNPFAPPADGFTHSETSGGIIR